MIDDSDNEVAVEWAIQNPVIVHSSPTICGLFFFLGVVINQVSSPSIGPNNVDIGKTSVGENTIAVTGGTGGGGNTIAVKSDIRNEGAEEPKRHQICCKEWGDGGAK